MEEFNMQEGLAFVQKYDLSSEAETELIALLERAVASSSDAPTLRNGESLDFAAFWEAYPRKVAKGAARKAWKAMAKIRPSVEHLLLALEDQCASEEGMSDEKKFMPHASTWLRAEQWEDEVDIDQPVGGPTPQQRLKALREKRAKDRNESDRKKLGDDLGKMLEKGGK